MHIEKPNAPNSHRAVQSRSFASNGLASMDDEERAYHIVYNPNQLQFIEDEKRYLEKMHQLQAGNIL